MKKLLCLLGGAMLLLPAIAQKTTLEQYLNIGDRLPEINFNHVLYYKDSTVTLSEFQQNKSKLVIFDFWFTNCSSCIEQFPKLDSLQKIFNKNIQIVLVAHESKGTVSDFIKKWENKHHTTFQLPIVTDDALLHQLIRHRYESHYAWITPDNVLVAQTSPYFLNSDVLNSYLIHMPFEIASRGF